MLPILDGYEAAPRLGYCVTEGPSETQRKCPGALPRAAPGWHAQVFATLERGRAVLTARVVSYARSGGGLHVASRREFGRPRVPRLFHRKVARVAAGHLPSTVVPACERKHESGREMEFAFDFRLLRGERFADRIAELYMRTT